LAFSFALCTPEMKFELTVNGLRHRRF